MRVVVCAVALLAVASCGGDAACPSGSVASGDRCVVVDASVADAGDTGPRDMGPADAAVDEGAPDAGPCGMPCEGATPACDAVRGVCVQCTDADATACTGTTTPACESATGMCVQCGVFERSQCTGTTPLCDFGAGRCVGCMFDADCTTPGASECELATLACIGCTFEGACSRLTPTPVCDEVGATCDASTTPRQCAF